MLLGIRRGRRRTDRFGGAYGLLLAHRGQAHGTSAAIANREHIADSRVAVRVHCYSTFSTCHVQALKILDAQFRDVAMSTHCSQQDFALDGIKAEVDDDTCVRGAVNDGLNVQDGRVQPHLHTVCGQVLRDRLPQGHVDIRQECLRRPKDCDLGSELREEDGVLHCRQGRSLNGHLLRDTAQALDGGCIVDPRCVGVAVPVRLGARCDDDRLRGELQHFVGFIDRLEPDCVCVQNLSVASQPLYLEGAHG
mmetsp:Transcript_75014/g.208545  ORF Transcript_75014/g.208545 Transcript_75014/m.208545 type:complete len:250 (-) Transcript_75014:1679-2428(-)